jgi:hypothetical protein
MKVSDEIQIKGKETLGVFISFKISSPFYYDEKCYKNKYKLKFLKFNIFKILKILKN